jgi:hypothetical protein
VVSKKESTGSGAKVSILLPTSYRDNEPKQLNSDWFDLYEKNGDYFIEKAKYTISKGYDDCAQIETETIETKRNTLLLIDYKKLLAGKVDHLDIPKQYIWPGEKIEFFFNNVKYYLRGEGKIKNTQNRTNEAGESELWQEVEDYKLFIGLDKTAKELLLSEQSFNDTFVKLIFVGDLDKDGKLDFIFEASRNYEETRVLLFLSCESESRVLQKPAEISISFDC